MSDTGHTANGAANRETGAELISGRTPHRVIGTPPPAKARTLLGEAAPQEPGIKVPGEPPDPAKAKRAERVVATLFILSLVASLGFVAAYVGLEVHSVDATLRSNLALGVSMSVAFLAIGAGFVIWVRSLMPTVELTEERKPLASAPEDRAEFEETFLEGAEASAITKRPLLRRTLLAASVPLAAAPLVILRDMGPLPGNVLRHTAWRNGTRMVVYGPNTPLLAADFNTPGQMITVIPEGFQDNQDVLAKAVTIIIKLAPGQLKPPTVLDWTYDNIVAYSKICTHVGCPAALYEQTTNHILCPCHQSTFDATKGATVLFGPAPRPLPQLPIGVDSQGYLIAKGDFVVPVGPSFWELGQGGFQGGNE
ncbi:MAG TPA: Rieske 2Fe-2S domain-containing protein [Streptosporangiaceae bacterium]|nr:Rieske 2Fe-2S domain-containing protein [Streptosporangiaceae bacterium]